MNSQSSLITPPFSRKRSRIFSTSLSGATPMLRTSFTQTSSPSLKVTLFGLNSEMMTSSTSALVSRPVLIKFAHSFLLAFHSWVLPRKSLLSTMTTLWPLFWSASAIAIPRFPPQTQTS